MKTAQAIHLYATPTLDLGQLKGVLEELGLETEALHEDQSVEYPAVILLGPGQQAPRGLDEIAIRLQFDAPAPALREMLRYAIENVTLKQEVKHLQKAARDQHRQFEELNRIGIALSAERDIHKLQELILTTMRELTNADGASLWLTTHGPAGQPLLFLASSQSQSIADDTYQAFTVALDEKTVVGYAVFHGTNLLYDDAYHPPEGRPLGGEVFDKKYGYRTKSMLTVPMRSYDGTVVGAVQLINAKRRAETILTLANTEAEVISFVSEDLEMIESIASQAAVAIDNKRLLDSIEMLFDGFVKASVTAVEQRDPITAGHSERVEGYTMGIARAVMEIGTGRYREVHFTDDQLKELSYACLLHDFGKVGVREQILQKARKLYPGQIELIQTRFSYVISSIRERHAGEKFELARTRGFDDPGLADLDARQAAELAEMQEWLNAIVTADVPTVLDEDKASVLEFLSKRTYMDPGGRELPLLEPAEFKFLSIRRGTFDDEERREMEAHVTKSFNFLARIPWTQSMKAIPEIAYGHHEFLNGMGYPRKLSGDQIPIQARMMTIADIYDALTAKDRPYKPAVPVDRALGILQSEANEGKLDRELLDVFIAKRVYEEKS